MHTPQHDPTGTYRRLLDIAASLNNSATIDQTLTIMAQPALENGAEFASMMYIDLGDDGQPQTLEFVAKAGNTALGYPTGTRLDLWESPIVAGTMGDPTRTLFIPDVHDPNLPDDTLRRMLNAYNIAAAIAVPLYKQGEWIALAAFYWREPQQFSDELTLIYRHLSTLASPMVENQRVRTHLSQQGADPDASLRVLADDLIQRTRTLDDILSAMPRQFVMIDRDGRVLYVNPSTLQTFGVTEQQVIGQHWESVQELSEGVFATVKAQIEQAFSSGEPVQFEQTFNTTGGERFLEVTMTPIHGEDGTMLAVAVTSQDITERKQAEAHARDLAVERERKWLLTRLVRGAGHEFRNPLAVIRTKLYLIERVNDPDRRREHLAILAQQVDTILSLVESLHTIALLEDPNNYDFTDLIVAQLLDRAVGRHEAAINVKNHAFQLHPGDDAMKIHACEELIAQAIDQLCDNAIKYTPSGGEITLSAFPVDDNVCIRVRDNGPGIAPEHHEEVFEYFRWIQVPGVERGHGLGLPLAQKIAALHGGRITLESTPGEGTAFDLYLPLKQGG